MSDETNDEESVRAKEQHEKTKALLNTDLADSPEDEAKMQPEEVIMDMPDVSDIPGQEHILVPDILEMQDTTISSDDEEGVGLFDDDDADEDTELIMGNDADVSKTEQTLLERSADDEPDGDDTRLRRSELDNEDKEGEPLNEGSLATDVSGGDLDTSGVDSDDAMEAIGEEDEENNTYSLGSDSNDNLNEGTP